MINTREVIQSRLLTDIDNKYDKSEGSFFYDTLKPVSIELESIYTIIDGMLDKHIVDTATGLDLDRIVKNVAISRKLSTKAKGIVTITGLVGSTIVKGEKVASDGVNYIFKNTSTISESGIIDVEVECELYGSKGNVQIDSIKYFPKTLKGLYSVTNKEPFINGYDMEDDESLRKRYYTKVQTIVNSSNKNAYKSWALEITGVGDVRVLPLWKGPGTVKVIIINSNKAGANEALVNTVQNYIDPNKNGDGSGIAPCGGGVCTVQSAIEKQLAIKCNIVTSLDNEVAKKLIESEIKEYLAEIAFDEEIESISYAKIGSLIIGIKGISDYSNLLVNNGTSNVDIKIEEVAVLGGVVLG